MSAPLALEAIEPGSSWTTSAILAALSDRGESEAWAQFDRRYRPILGGVLRALGLSPDDAADASQEVLLQFVRALRTGGFDGRRARLRPWLISAARSRAIDHLRKHRPASVGETALCGLPDEDRLDEVWEAEARRHLLAEALARLRQSGMERSTILAFERFALQGHDAEEVARSLGMRVGAVYLAKHRCVQHLRGSLHELERSLAEDELPNRGR